MRPSAPPMVTARLRRLGGETLLVATGQGLAALGGLVGVGVLTRALDPQCYGELALGAAAAALLQQILVQPPFEAALRFLSTAHEAGETTAYLTALRALVGRALLFLGGIALGTSALLVGFGYARWLGMLAAVAAFTAFSIVNAALNGVQSGGRQRAVVAWHEGAGQWLRFLLAAAAVRVLGARSSLGMAGYAAAVGLVAASQVVFLRRHPVLGPALRSQADAFDCERWRVRLGEYAWPFAAWGIFAGLHTMSGRWALQLAADTRAVGFFAVLQQLGYYPVILSWTMVVQLLAPVIFGRAGSGYDAARTRRGQQLCWATIAGTGALTLAAAAAAAGLHRRLFLFAAAPAYADVSPLLPAVVLGAGIFACAQTGAFLFMVEARTRELVPTKIATALVGIGLNLLGARLHGVAGVVYGGIAYSTLYLVVVLHQARGRSRTAPPPSQPS